MFTIGETLVSVLAITTTIGCGVTGWQWRSCRQRLVQSVRDRKAAQASEQTAIRQIRVTSQQLRQIVLDLNGMAEQLGEDAAGTVAYVARASANVLDVADCMQDFAMKGDREVKLDCETINLGFFLDQIIASLKVSGDIGPRQWEVSAALSEARLLGDARALRHVLTRTLGVVVGGTQPDDGIAVRVEPRGTMAALVSAGVRRNADVGDSSANAVAKREGLRLKLAESLVAAHGGQLEILQRDGTGPEVTLCFPAARFSLGGAADKPVVRTDRTPVGGTGAPQDRFADVLAA